MLRYAVLGLIGLVPGAAVAQQAPSPVGIAAPSSSPASVQPSQAAISWEEPQVRDHWTFEIWDEITGKVSASLTQAVTEVTPTNLRVAIKLAGTDTSNYEGVNVYDRSWNLVSDGSWQHFPYDGTTGIQTPLTVGKIWTFQSTDTNNASGAVWRRSGTSKVVGQETVTTRAGTFETFKIETNTSSINFKDPARTEDWAIQAWYAPAIARWVKRIGVTRTDKHLRSNLTYELVEYGRE